MVPPPGGRPGIPLRCLRPSRALLLSRGGVLPRVHAPPEAGAPVTEKAMLQVIHEDGTYDVVLEPKLSEERLQEMYRALIFIRTLDTRMLSLQRQGRIGFYVPSSGEEATQVGSVAALGKEDWIFPAYREPGTALWRGYPLASLISPFYGNAEGLAKGRGTPHQSAHRELRIASISSPVGTQIPHAVGCAG